MPESGAFLILHGPSRNFHRPSVRQPDPKRRGLPDFLCADDCRIGLFDKARYGKNRTSEDEKTGRFMLVAG